MSHIIGIKKVVVAGIALAGMIGLSACNGASGVGADPYSPNSMRGLNIDQVKQEALKLANNASTRGDELAFSAGVSCLTMKSKEAADAGWNSLADGLQVLSYTAQVSAYVFENFSGKGDLTSIQRFAPQSEAEAQKVTDITDAVYSKYPDDLSFNDATTANCTIAQQIRSTTF